jgi:hypothetical protein
MTDVEIANLALGYLGVKPIVAFTDGSAEANLCQAFYGPTKQALLEERAWTFAKTEYSATPDATAPTFDWVARYAVPADCLRVLKVDDGEGTFRIGWERVGAFIHTDREVADLYIYGIDGTVAEALFSPSFSFALAARLAAEVCIPLTKDDTLHTKMLKVAEIKLREAAGLDGSQGKSERLRSDSLSLRR